MKLKGIGINKYTGTGKIIHIDSFKEFSRIKGGEIIVTKNATPDFVLILNKISCLITDQGGITCHIAILCREFNTPAILATKYGTSKLVNGSEVHVDTSKGLIWSM